MPIVQVKLCKEVLDNIYLVGAQKLQNSVTQETWESWLKLLLGVVDSIFRNRGNSGAVAHSFLIKSLGPPAFRVLCEVWLLSKTENPDLWGAFQNLASSWLIVPTVRVSPRAFACFSSASLNFQFASLLFRLCTGALCVMD